MTTTPYHSNTSPPLRGTSFSSSQSSQSNPSSIILDHSHLKPGKNASLLSYDKTIQMYRDSLKKSKNPRMRFDFANFLFEMGYHAEAEKMLRHAATRGHTDAQYTLALKMTDHEKAFPLFEQAAKHHHPDAAYRTAKCYEEGLGTRRDKKKAVQFYRKAATLNHPGAMYRLGTAQIKGELGLSRNIRDGHKWLKRSAEAATSTYPHALHELALLHEHGCGSTLFLDHPYAVSLYHEASLLRHGPSCRKLGEAYEYGRLGCPKDLKRSVYYYGIGAKAGDPESCLALSCFAGVGSDQEAFEWALKAAEAGLAKAEYAVGYFKEMGVGTVQDREVALAWYQKAALHGDSRAIELLEAEAGKSGVRSNQVNRGFFKRASSFFSKKSI